MSKSTTVQHIKKSRDFLDNIFKPYVKSLGDSVLSRTSCNPDDYCRVYLTNSQKILIQNFLCLLRSYNKYTPITVKEEDTNITMIVTISRYPYKYEEYQPIEMYKNILPGKDKYIVVMPFIPRLQLIYPSGGTVKKFNSNTNSIIYTEKTLNMLLNYYTFEQFNDVAIVNRLPLIPELWNIIYNYMFAK